ncbi:MAG: ABC transporter substrate-binding protein [Synergistaceae bacterium]|jgi:branched-chain amino acid transport system substrate-binding protein|nr:ABC transporter substrate-binding protein [Synergistaceae bacterium]
MRKLFGLLLLCVVSVFSFTRASGWVSDAWAAPAAGEPIRIGLVNPRSGNLAITGDDDHWGARLAVDMFNERGGVNGRPIQTVEADIPDAATAQTEINRLIQNENLKLITGCYGSSIVEVAASICDRNDVFWWENVSVLDRLTEQGYKAVFRVHISGSIFGEEAAKIAVAFGEKIGIKPQDLKLGVVSENSDFGQSLSVGVRRYAKANNLNLMLDELYDAKTTDTSPIVLKMKDADPDIVIVTSYINDGIDITKKSKIFNYAPKVFLGIGSGYNAAAYPKNLGQDAEGQLDLDPTNAPAIAKLDPETQKLVKEFSERFEKQKGFPPTTVGYLAWQATWVLLNNVIAVVGDVNDLDALIAAAKKIDIPVGTLPTGAGVKFDEKGQNERCVIAVMQWTDGRLVTIYPDFLATKEPEYIPMPAWDVRFK